MGFFNKVMFKILGEDKYIKLNQWKRRKGLLERIKCKARIQHEWGVEKIQYEKDEAIVVCIVRNGEVYVKSFIEHYFSLGVKHIVLLDNDSEDNTVAIAQKYKSVTIYKIKDFMRKDEKFFENHFINKFCKNRWCINVDIDELLDHPFSDVIGLKELLTYLNTNSYTAVVGQMLDMFSEKPLSEMTCSSADSV